MCDYHKDNGEESSLDKVILILGYEHCLKKPMFTLGYEPSLEKLMFTLWYTLLFPRTSFFLLTFTFNIWTEISLLNPYCAS